ncbi:MAG: ABC transporter ATP-binding protein [Halorhodospira halophila]|uniref:ATP-binding cassette domain-containing protein n=1 Tax=Halorhodospira TaxID=85108 RepID=UPI001912718D|nr:ABC transporter ATP-binding protein [Halorhodospira halophila]MCC3750004.1 ABC transporter ATP-binding protein [Halorhodospira halophila]MCG5538768.1 ABC transporter ATP-binding protein [Halorhodospira sp. 9622]MCG5541577.1 ABC transporter ATP-binding protein [Halorhodospira sp. M39old]MCG5544640.1 ABC transporter ATP-binding protein [Halorhodospira sp. M38]
MTATGIELRGVRYAYRRTEVLRGVDARVEAGEVVALIGPNGSGKSTLLKCITGILRPRHGTLTIAGEPVQGQRQARIARRLSYVAQTADAVYPLTVLESVLLGLRRASWRHDPADLARAEAVLERLGMADLAQAPLTEISGGQRQKAAIARALVRQTPFLLLDEPTNHLDMKHKRDAIEILTACAREQGQGVLVVLHDINIAVQLADRIVLLRDGRVMADGPPQAVIDTPTIRAAYDVDVRVVEHQQAPFVVGYRLQQRGGVHDG